MTIKINLFSIMFRCLLALLIIICCYNFKINPNLFGFLIVLFTVIIVVMRTEIIKISETEIEFISSRIIYLMNSTTTIKLSNIKSVEYSKGDSSLLVLFLGIITGYGTARYKQKDKLVIKLKNDLIFEYVINGKKDEFKKAIALINKNLTAY